MESNTQPQESELDTTRGIRNAQVRYKEHADARTLRNQLLARRSQRRRKKQNIDPEQEAANEAYFEELQNAQALQTEAQLLNAKKRAQKIGASKGIKKLTSAMKWAGLGIAGTGYTFQFLFALLSLIFFIMNAGVKEFTMNTLLGKAIASFVSIFVDIQNMTSLNDAGMICWGIATLVAVSLFSVFASWYKFNGIHPFGTTISIFITFLCISLSILPIMNIFPWILLWIVYMNASSLFSSD